MILKRGDVWWVDFDGSIGGEIQKVRPAVVISNNESNKKSNRVQVVPLTTNVKKLYSCEAYIFIKGIKNKAKADQIMTVSKERVKSKITTLSDNDIWLIEQAVKVQLGLPCILQKDRNNKSNENA